MAAVMASKPAPAPSKMKKPSLPQVQTHGQPSSSPSSATKRPPGQQPPTPVSATPASANNPRPNRRPQRVGTRNGTTDTLPAGKKTMKEFPEPHVVKQSHILKKYRKSPVSLKIHLHPTHFRFDQQDGSFSYHSELRCFIEHLAKGTVPHDMMEEFRRSDVPFYEGWLIVRVLDHRTTTNSASALNGANDDGKPFSIHNYTPYITPSPYAPYPTKEQTGQKSPRLKQESKDAGSTPSKEGASDAHSDDTVEAAPKTNKPQPKVFTVALRPTILSRHMDSVIDAMTPDPKSLNRKQSAANVNSRTPGSAVPQTPVSGIPSTPAIEKGPPLKKLKMRIDAKDLLEYEARTVNATAPPLYLEPVESLEESESVLNLLQDPFNDTRAPSSKSRKRTVAELAADDALAKGQERFMLILDERTAGNATGTNAAAVDAQAGAALFQPRFEKFNALETIKRDLAERKQREKDRQLQEDENRRAMQEQQAEQTRQRNEQIRRREQAQRELRQQQENAHRAAIQEQTLRQRNQAMQAAQAAQAAQQAQASGIPPQMQNRMMAPQQTSSPIIRQGTPQHAASSPVVNNMTQNAQNMAAQQAAGSPARPGSAVQHGHPGVAMARGPSNQGPSRHGTPQIPHSTPGMRNATPVMRQPTPAQHAAMTQASPHGSMMAPTPQMAQASMPQQINGMQVQMTPHQQQAELNRRHMMQQQAMQQRAHQQNMMNGNPSMTPAQLAHLQAQQLAQQQQRAAMAQAGTPQQVAQSPAQGTAQYKQAVAEQMKAQMQHLQQGQSQGSPAPHQMTPQQQAANIAHVHQQQAMARAQQQQQQQQQGQMMGAPQMQQGQPRPMNPQMQQMFTSLQQQYHNRFLQQAAQRYAGNMAMLQPQDHQQAQVMARKLATSEMQKRMAAHQQSQRQQAQQQAGGGGQPAMMMAQGQMNQGQMQAMMQQQQAAAQQMQMAQMANAQQQMNGMQGGQGNPAMQNSGMQSMANYQAQLQAMQRQAQQGQQGQQQ